MAEKQTNYLAIDVGHVEPPVPRLPGRYSRVLNVPPEVVPLASHLIRPLPASHVSHTSPPSGWRTWEPPASTNDSFRLHPASRRWTHHSHPVTEHIVVVVVVEHLVVMGWLSKHGLHVVIVGDHGGDAVQRHQLVVHDGQATLGERVQTVLTQFCLFLPSPLWLLGCGRSFCGCCCCCSGGCCRWCWRGIRGLLIGWRWII